MTLTDYLDLYLEDRPVSANYATELALTVQRLDDWHKLPVALDTLSTQLIDRWLHETVRPTRQKWFRATIMTLWRTAFDAGVTDNEPPARIPRRHREKAGWQLHRPERAGAAVAELTPTMTLRDYLDGHYATKRSIGTKTAQGYDTAIVSLCRHAKHDVRIEELTPELVNGWLRAIETTVKPVTLMAYRRHLLVIWRSAHDDELLEALPLRIRKLRLSPRIPTAWTVDEVRLLVAAAKRVEGNYPLMGVTKATWWELAIRAAWDEGLREGDFLNQPHDLFAADRLRATLIQHKTRRPVLVGWHPSTWALWQACPSWPTLIWWGHCRRHFSTEFASIVKAAGLVGSWTKLRKSSGSNVEAHFPGYGSVHLGHSQGPQVTTAHYLDPRIVQAQKPMPTEL
ncbi:MAG: hypothetical protein U0836_20555 [Pirellulales bacterium]